MLPIVFTAACLNAKIVFIVMQVFGLLPIWRWAIGRYVYERKMSSKFCGSKRYDIVDKNKISKTSPTEKILIIKTKLIQ